VHLGAEGISTRGRERRKGREWFDGEAEGQIMIDLTGTE
jgi:hypothetical protein